MNRFLSTLAIVALILFFGVFLYRVPRIDLGIVLVVTLALALFDTWKSVWLPHMRK